MQSSWARVKLGVNDSSENQIKSAINLHCILNLVLTRISPSFCHGLNCGLLTVCKPSSCSVLSAASTDGTKVTGLCLLFGFLSVCSSQFKLCFKKKKKE